jgi:AcrR family transcriptional regulator
MAPEQRREQLLDVALGLIAGHGYGGVSIEAIARTAGVTRPVVYDHFPNLGRLLYALIEREEHYSLDQLDRVIPGGGTRQSDPVGLLAGAVKRFLDAVVDRPATWRLILLPAAGTPEIVRAHVETNRARMLERIEELVAHAIKRGELPAGLDPELTARAIRDLGEEAGRMVLTDPERYSPERYERFVQQVSGLLLQR